MCNSVKQGEGCGCFCKEQRHKKMAVSRSKNTTGDTIWSVMNKKMGLSILYH